MRGDIFGLGLALVLSHDFLLLLVPVLAGVRLPRLLLLIFSRRSLRSGLRSRKQVRLRSPVVCALVGLQDAPE